MKAGKERADSFFLYSWFPNSFFSVTSVTASERIIGYKPGAGNIGPGGAAGVGCGAGNTTFALPLARGAKVHAVEQDQAALAALAVAAKSEGLKPVTTEVRDLFKLPLTPLELNGYDAVVLDPPRAGAEGQAKALARSKVPLLAYVSCNAMSFARDAALLVAGGYRMGSVTPIDQFLWSSHIELVGGFARP